MDELAFSVVFECIPVDVEPGYITPPVRPRTPPSDGKGHRPHRQVNAPANSLAESVASVSPRSARLHAPPQQPHQPSQSLPDTLSASLRANVAFGKSVRATPRPTPQDNEKTKPVPHGPTAEEVQHEIAEDELRIAKMREQYPAHKQQPLSRTEVTPCTFLGSEDVSSSFFLLKVAQDIKVQPHDLMKSSRNAGASSVPEADPSCAAQKYVQLPESHASATPKRVCGELPFKERQAARGGTPQPLKLNALLQVSSPKRDSLNDDAPYLGDDDLAEGTTIFPLSCNKGYCEGGIATQTPRECAPPVAPLHAKAPHYGLRDNMDCEKVNSPGSACLIPVRQVQVLRLLSDSARRADLPPHYSPSTSPCGQLCNHPNWSHPSLLSAFSEQTLSPRPHPNRCCVSPAAGAMSLVTFEKANPESPPFAPEQKGLLSASMTSLLSSSQHHFHVVCGTPAATLQTLEAERLHDEASTTALALHDHMFSSQKAAQSSVLVIEPSTLLCVHKKCNIRLFEEDDPNDVSKSRQ